MEAMQYNPQTKAWDAVEVTEQAWQDDRANGRDARQLLSKDEYQSLQRAAKHFYRPETPELAALACQRNRLSR